MGGGCCRCCRGGCCVSCCSGGLRTVQWSRGSALMSGRCKQAMLRTLGRALRQRSWNSTSPLLVGSSQSSCVPDASAGATPSMRSRNRALFSQLHSCATQPAVDVGNVATWQHKQRHERHERHEQHKQLGQLKHVAALHVGSRAPSLAWNNQAVAPALKHFRQQSRSMFIQTQNTPNPQSLMFIPGKTVC